MKKLLILGSVLLLVACAGDKSADTHNSDKETPPKVSRQDLTKDLICPQVAILQAGEEIMDYGGEKPDPSQLVAKARMKSVEGDCSYQEKGIDIAFSLRMKSQRGPRLGGSQASFPYFVAVVDPSENIVSRQTLTAHFIFADREKTADDAEQLHILIPLKEPSMLAGPDYRVFVAFPEPKVSP